MEPHLVLGLASAVAWGTADFCAKKGSDRLGFWPTLLGMNLVGALALLILALAGVAPISLSLTRMYLPLAAGNTLGGLLFYYAIEHGPLSLVSPITAGYPAVSAVLAFVIAKERLSLTMAIAIVAVIAGTVLASIQGSAALPATRRADGKGAFIAAAGTVLVFGAVFFALAAQAGHQPPLAPVLVFRCAGAAILMTPLVIGKRLPRGWWRSEWVLSTGLLDTAAYIFYVYAARGLSVSLTSALGGMFSAWTLVLACIFLRERPSRRQWAGVAIILAAVGGLAFVH